MAARRKNLFGFGSASSSSAKQRRSSLTIGQAAKQARELGYRGGDFSLWVHSKGLDQRSSGFVSRMGDAYRSGMDQREREDALRQARKDRIVADRLNKQYLARQRAEKQKEDRNIKQGLRDAKRIAKKEKREDQAKAARSKRLSTHEAKGIFSDLLNPGKRRKNAMSRADKATLKDLAQYGQTISTAFVPGVYPAAALVDAFSSKKNPRKKRNPADAAAVGFEEFHGYAPDEEIVMVKQMHYHKNLSAAGDLRCMKVIRATDGGLTKLTKFKGAILAFNEKKNQLFVEGGDQAVCLESFGLDPDKAHELEVLGEVKRIDYFTEKTHLGDEGGRAVYEHGFRMTNENGKHVIVKIARNPTLIYSVPNEQLYFAGGSYLIRAEGIDQ